MTNAKHGRLALLVALFVTALPLAAQAQRKSPLADAPAIRKRVELRERRFELGAGVGSTIGQDFYHSVFVNVKLAGHITDWLSISGFGGFAFANMQTGFNERLDGSLMGETGTGITRAPSQAQAEASMVKIKMLAGAQLEFTPFTGKYSMFGKLFAHYDFYLFGGPGFLNVAPTNESGIAACGQKCTSVSGWKFGGQFGVGLHTFFNQVVALNVELRDIYAPKNYSGRDTNGDGVANDDDLKWGSTFMVAGNIVFYLPTVAGISP
jgi:outer membrane beta-barrel protein